MAGAAQSGTKSRRDAWIQILWLSLTAILGLLTKAALVSLAALALFALLAHGVAEGATNAFDVSVVHAIHSRIPSSLHQAILWFTFLANGPTIAAVLSISVLFLAISGRVWPDAGALLLSGFGGYGFVEAVKSIFHRPRPDLAMGVTGFSFPSGHSFLSTAVYGMLAYYLGLHLDRTGRIFVWLAAGFVILLIGSSRVLLGVHYPSDVLAGFSSGLAWLWVCLSLRRIFAKRDWRDWREERLGRLAAAYRLLDESEGDRNSLHRLARALLADGSASSMGRIFVQVGLWVERSYGRASRRFRALRRHPYDLLLLGSSLRAASRSGKERHSAALERELEETRITLRQLWTAQRGLFGLSAEPSG